MLQSAFANPRLFPRDMMVAAWTPFLLIPENIPLIRELSTSILCSRSRRDGDCIGCLSILQVLFPNDWILVTLNLYSDGVEPSHKEELTEHIKYHLRTLVQKKYERKVYFHLVAHDNVDIHSIIAYMKHLPLDSRSDWEVDMGFILRTPLKDMIKSNL